MSEENEEVVDRGDEIIEETEAEETPEVVEEVSAEEDAGLEEEDAEEVVAEEPKEPMLPKSRYDSVAAKNRELEARIAEMEAQGRQEEAQAQREEQTYSLEEHIAALDEQYADAVKDGDSAAMARIRAEQRNAEREMFRMEMQQTGEQSASQAREQVRLDLTIDAIEENYTQLNPNGDDYDQALVDEIQELRNGFEATGKYSPTQALIRAVKIMIPDAPATAENKVDKAADSKSLKKKVAAANKQPPSLDSVGEQGNAAGKDTNDPDPSQMSIEDMEALPESTLKRMRGDIF